MEKKNKTKSNSITPPAHKGGMPLKYTPEFIEKLAPEMVTWFRKRKNWWLKSFAIQQGFSPNRLNEFANKSEVFREAMELCKAIQEEKLVNKGFQAYKDRFAIFMLKNVSGYKDRTDITSGDEKISAVEVLIRKSKKDSDK